MARETPGPAGKGAHRHPYPAAVPGNLGDVRPVGGGVSELRIDYGPGYRVYFLKQGVALVILLAGGDKSSQADDITKARNLARILSKEQK